MTNHPGRRKPTWVAAAEALAESRIAAIQWPESAGLHAMTSDQVAQLIRDTTVWAYGQGLRAATLPPAGRRAR